MEKDYFNKKLYEGLLNTYNNRFEGDKIVEAFYSYYTKPLIRNVVYLLSDPDTKYPEVKDYMCESGFNKMRKYYGIDTKNNAVVDDSSIILVLSRAITRIVFEAELKYLKTKVKKSGPINPETYLKAFFLPSTVTKTLRWDIYNSKNKHIDEADLQLSHLLSGVIDRETGTQFRDDIRKFARVCTGKAHDSEVIYTEPVEQVKLPKESKEVTNLRSLLKEVEETIVTKYKALLEKKKQLETEISCYKGLLSERKNVEDEIATFEETVKSLGKKLGDNNGE